MFSHPDRDPRGRVISVAFFALISSDKIELTATEDAAQAKWWPLDSLPALAFDHRQLFDQALLALKEAVMIKSIAFELLPNEFTLTMWQNLYEQIYGMSIDKRNFRKKMLKMEFIVPTSKTTRHEKHRPAKFIVLIRQSF